MQLTPEEAQRLAVAVSARRAALNLKQEQLTERGGPSKAVLSMIENGRQLRYKARTEAQLCTALEWTSDDFRRALAGVSQPADAVAPQWLVGRLDALDKELRALRNEVRAGLGGVIAVLEGRASEIPELEALPVVQAAQP